jgi:hypothetical protein
MNQVLREKLVTTRKEHQCWGCLKVFPAQTQMLLQAVLNEGSVSNEYTCKDCQGWIKDNTGEWSIEDWESISPGSIGRWKNGVWYPQN